MTNMKVQFKRLEKNPDSNPGNSMTVPGYLEKIYEGYIKGYVGTPVSGRYESLEVHAIVLNGNKLENISLKDITVLTDEE